MGVRTGAARAASVLSTWALKRLFHRPAANFPGKLALYLDPALIGNLRGKLARGSICVVGTNGKTTVTNLLADALNQAGRTVSCNRTGANLDSGVATELLHTKGAEWGVFECDELWLGRILPQLQSEYVILLNLFRDQLDRVGEIDRTQQAIADALAASPASTLIYNADDPLCQAIANRVPNRSFAFGIGEDLGLPQNTVSDARMCQECESMLAYEYRQYGQLGSYACPSCGFARASLDLAAREVQVDASGMRFALYAGCRIGELTAGFTGTYMVYNLLALASAFTLMGEDLSALQKAIGAFDPRNGRLEELSIGGRRVLLNLAKNPTGFNQNLKLVAQDARPLVAAFFVNDREADGRDISWIWDVDFEELARRSDILVYAGGTRAYDLAVRLKYAGVRAEVIEGVGEALAACAKLPVEVGFYAIANYTSLPQVRSDLEAFEAGARAPGAAPERLVARAEAFHAQVAAAGRPDGPVEGDGSAEGDGLAPAAPSSAPASTPAAAPSDAAARPVDGGLLAQAQLQERPFTIVHLYPDLLNLYGDGGNVTVLERRLAWRGIPVRVLAVEHACPCDEAQQAIAGADLLFLGGGPDREQKLASDQLLALKGDIARFVADGGPVLAICGGYQILGPEWLMGTGSVEGLGIAPIETRRVPDRRPRLIGNIALTAPMATLPVIGYENHAGRTFLFDGAEPFGRIASGVGFGNNDDSGADGILMNSLIGTYLHGPLLGKNPEIADFLIARGLERRAGRPVELPALDDAEERAANAFMARRLKVDAVERRASDAERPVGQGEEGGRA